MTKAIYKIFDLATADSALAAFCYYTFLAGLFIFAFIGGNKFALLLTVPTLFFIAWFILATVVLGIEKLIIAPIEFVVYKLGIPKIKINVDVIWKYQQRR